ncbi:MAG: winged helix-turn-helix domain-containing protein [Anaerolineales bacterium]|nr:winged helix-turn-helix domain-containing protein [Anaerolineales bacterium]
MQKFAQSDDFGSFLWSVQQAVHQRKGQDTPMLIMHNLARQKKTPVAQMMTRVKVSWADFNDALKYLEEAGLVKMEEDENGSMLCLTEEGRHWAQTINGEWGEADEAENASGEERE